MDDLLSAFTNKENYPNVMFILRKPLMGNEYYSIALSLSSIIRAIKIHEVKDSSLELRKPLCKEVDEKTGGLLLCMYQSMH